MSLLPFISVDEFDYTLPLEKIAESPTADRDQSKLLIFRNGVVEDKCFFNIPEQLPQKSLLILNNSRVIAARLYFIKDTGGAIEIFCLEPYNLSIEKAMEEQQQVEWQCLIGGASKWKPGLILKKKVSIDNDEVVLEAKFVGKKEDCFIISFSWNHPLPFSMVLENAGAIPLPPYIKRTPNLSDPERYQTVFAKTNGSVAAPTAALHFTPEVFQKLEAKAIKHQYITLHVGAGTFKPMKSESATDHSMHSEPFSVRVETLAELIKTDIIIAVGTTSLRTLESLYWLGVKLNKGDETFNLSQWEAYELDSHLSYQESIQLIIQYLKGKGEKTLECRTSLMIVPGYHFKSAKALITNFHQPRSTLLLLIAAFTGSGWKQIYEHALQNNYRFLSYGDSSLLWRNT